MISLWIYLFIFPWLLKPCSCTASQAFPAVGSELWTRTEKNGTEQNICAFHKVCWDGVHWVISAGKTFFIAILYLCIPCQQNNLGHYSEYRFFCAQLDAHSKRKFLPMKLSCFLEKQRELTKNIFFLKRKNKRKGN